MIREAVDYRKYLDPTVLAGIAGLDLRARLLVEGFISGMHRSPLHGMAIEFAEHRKYSQGDDLRFLDWKVFGRTDKHYIKEYETETNLRMLLAVDCSESMSYRSSGTAMSKRDYAITLAAGLSYLALQQADSVGLATFSDALRRTARSSNHAGQWKLIIRELQHAPAAGRTEFRRVLDELAESLEQRHLVVVLSDLLGPAEEIIAGLKHLRHCRHEAVVLQTLDHSELTFPFDGPTQLLGMEGAGMVWTDPRAIRKRYLEEVDKHHEAIRRECHTQQVDYTLLDTSESLKAALAAYLATRSARIRRWN